MAIHYHRIGTSEFLPSPMFRERDCAYPEPALALGKKSWGGKAIEEDAQSPQFTTR